MEEERPKKWFDISPWVFGPSVALIFGIVVWTVLNLDTADTLFGNIMDGITRKFGWFFILAVNFYLIVAIWISFSPGGKVRLGGEDAKPGFSTLSWFAMLFSAGMGIGLVFYSVAEPLYHLMSPPTQEPMTQAAAREAMQVTFFHWGIHAWAIYGLVSLSLAYFSYNRGLPLSIRSAFHPLIGKHIHGAPGHAIDTLAVVATLFGVATSLGLGVKQVNAGLNHLFGWPQNATMQVFLIAGITLLATISVVSGVKKGIRLLSEFNLWCALALLLLVLFAGPTIYLLDAFAQNLGHYIQRVFLLSFWTETYSVDAEGNRTTWQHSWTLFYWAWWISWSPFVGMFIARISRGRTVRELIWGVLLVPSLVTFFWLSVFGNAGLYEEFFGGGEIHEIVSDNMPVALFALLENYPLGQLASGLAILVIMSFFITSSDSGSLVIDIITSGGKADPPVIQRIFWAVTEGVVAAVLLLASGGGLKALQTGAVATGLPFAFVLILMGVSLFKVFVRGEK